MIGLRGGGHASQKSSRVEICIAVADWARGLMTWVLDVPGGEGTGATRRKPQNHVKDMRYRVSRSGTTDVSNVGSSSWGRGAGMVVGWG